MKNLLSLLKKKPKLFCLPNPDSPTGSSLNNKLLEKIFKICEKNNCYILIDEAYHLFYKSSQIKNSNIYRVQFKKNNQNIDSMKAKWGYFYETDIKNINEILYAQKIGTENVFRKKKLTRRG